MSKLSPKYNQENSQHSWESLDQLLQSGIKLLGEASINYTEYPMSKDEIITEAEKNGYKVTVSGDQLHFK